MKKIEKNKNFIKIIKKINIFSEIHYTEKLQ